MFKFLHAADLHMDSPLAGLTSLGEDIAKTVATASRKAFKRMLDLARSEKVQFMVISGDILDGAIRDHGTIQFLLNELGVLAQTIPVYLIRGNHDALNTAGTGMIWPVNVFEQAFQSPFMAKVSRNGPPKRIWCAATRPPWKIISISASCTPHLPAWTPPTTDMPQHR
jgi:DNA repair exonuclease SbcCD nuclease subunit